MWGHYHWGTIEWMLANIYLRVHVPRSWYPFPMAYIIQAPLKLKKRNWKWLETWNLKRLLSFSRCQTIGVTWNIWSPLFFAPGWNKHRAFVGVHIAFPQNVLTAAPGHASRSRLHLWNWATAVYLYSVKHGKAAHGKDNPKFKEFRQAGSWLSFIHHSFGSVNMRPTWFAGESYCVPCMSQRKCLPLHAMSHLSAIMHARSIPNHKVTSFPPFPCTLAHCKPSRSWNYQATRPFGCLQSTARLWGITINVIEPYRAIAKNHFPKLLKQNTTWKQWLKKTHPPSAAKPFQCPSLRHLFPTNAVEEHGRIGVGSQTESIMIFPPRVPYVIPYHCAKPSWEVWSWLLKTHVLLFQMLHKNLRWFM